jgi:acetylornithine/succinyldiaminopimelate/putrescine aminotransferase
MIGIEFNLSNNKIQDILEKLREEKILVLMCGNKNQYIRLLPALNIKKEEIIIFLDKLEKILINY